MKKIRNHQLLAALILVGSLLSLVTFSAAAEKPAITVAQLAGPWQIALVGNTGCGASALLFVGTLSATGTATGTLTGSSAGCKPSSSTTTQTFTIISLNANGSGTAGLTCGSSCGWTFDIQVAPNKQMFNLVDVANSPGDELAGTAVKQ